MHGLSRTLLLTWLAIGIATPAIAGNRQALQAGKDYGAQQNPKAHANMKRGSLKTPAGKGYLPVDGTGSTPADAKAKALSDRFEAGTGCQTTHDTRESAGCIGDASKMQAITQSGADHVGDCHSRPEDPECSAINFIARDAQPGSRPPVNVDSALTARGEAIENSAQASFANISGEYKDCKSETYTSDPKVETNVCEEFLKDPEERKCSTGQIVTFDKHHLYKCNTTTASIGEHDCEVNRNVRMSGAYKYRCRQSTTTKNQSCDTRTNVAIEDHSYYEAMKPGQFLGSVTIPAQGSNLWVKWSIEYRSGVRYDNGCVTNVPNLEGFTRDGEWTGTSPSGTQCKYSPNGAAEGMLGGPITGSSTLYVPEQVINFYSLGDARLLGYRYVAKNQPKAKPECRPYTQCEPGNDGDHIWDLSAYFHTDKNVQVLYRAGGRSPGQYNMESVITPYYPIDPGSKGRFQGASRGGMEIDCDRDPSSCYVKITYGYCLSPQVDSAYNSALPCRGFVPIARDAKAGAFSWQSQVGGWIQKPGRIVPDIRATVTTDASACARFR